jgi:hypothetical protein
VINAGVSDGNFTEESTIQYVGDLEEIETSIQVFARKYLHINTD